MLTIDYCTNRIARETVASAAESGIAGIGDLLERALAPPVRCDVPSRARFRVGDGRGERRLVVGARVAESAVAGRALSRARRSCRGARVAVDDETVESSARIERAAHDRASQVEIAQSVVITASTSASCGGEIMPGAFATNRESPTRDRRARSCGTGSCAYRP